MQLNKSAVQPRKGHQQDKYVGSIDPKTKLRNGKGTYSYDNKYFVYEGQYSMGKKHGQGTLTLGDGRTIKGIFSNDQLDGEAEIVYPDGSRYVGNLSNGERQGSGIFQSTFNSYDGQWKNNKKQGNGKFVNLTIQEQIVGSFKEDKPDGQATLKRYNYSYDGNFCKGKREGQGKQINLWSKSQEEEAQKPNYGKYEFDGCFSEDKFEGKGCYRSKEFSYEYSGEFQKGLPKVYPNQLRILMSLNQKNEEQVTQSQKTVVSQSQPIQLQLQTDSFNLYIDSVYQGPEVLDEVQPTPQEIENMTKNWQNQNKKNKSPPPMPDFNQPRMKKPDLVMINEENGRPFEIKLLKSNGEEAVEELKVDYRSEMKLKRNENQELKIEAAKKMEEDAGKKGGKKDNKGGQEYKVNVYKQNPSKRQKTLTIVSSQGQASLKCFELPDDFPPGKYELLISSPFDDFGKVSSLKKQLIVKTKQAGKKK